MGHVSIFTVVAQLLLVFEMNVYFPFSYFFLETSVQHGTSTAQNPLTLTLDLVEPPRRLGLVPRPLSTHRQSHSVSPSPVRAHILESPDVLPYYVSRIVVDRHCGQLRRQ